MIHHEVLVGTLTLLADERVLFAFDESYIQNPRRPVLSKWFETEFGELKTVGGCTSFKEIDIQHFAKLASRAHASERLVLNTGKGYTLKC